jgi:SAM-dependent methyltransferase
MTVTSSAQQQHAAPLLVPAAHPLLLLLLLQAKFLMGAYARHSLPGGKLSTVLELGCGPANHALNLAQRGVQAWALDSNAAMLAYAGAKAAAAGVDSNLTTVQGDMADFQIQVGTQQQQLQPQQQLHAAAAPSSTQQA